MYAFEYKRAASVEDAMEKHAEGDDARFLAGGMTLLPVLKLRLDQPGQLVDLGYVETLRGISDDSGEIVIGAMTAHAVVAGDQMVRRRISALANLAGGIGDPLVRNRGTIGGSLANNDPSADYPAAVLGLGATIVTDRREIGADEFITGMFETALDDSEMIQRVRFPIPARAGYGRFANPASRFPLAGVFVAQSAAGVRVGVTGAGPRAFRVTAMEDALAEDFSEDAIRDIRVSEDGFLSDIHATPEYRAHLVNVLARRAVKSALDG